MEYIKVVLKDLPCTVRAFTVYCYDEGQVWYTIVINARMGAEMQIKAYDHEMDHINHNDFDGMQSVTKLEYERHFA